MQYEVAWIIIAIFFWVLCAAAIVIGMAWAFCYVNYYRWDKEDRNKSDIVKQIQEEVLDKIDEELNGGGN